MSDDFKQKLINGALVALVSGAMSLAGLEKSEHDSSKQSNGQSWIGTNFESHTKREDLLQEQINELQRRLDAVQPKPQENK